jgi:hypothetical protein
MNFCGECEIWGQISGKLVVLVKFVIKLVLFGCISEISGEICDELFKFVVKLVLFFRY